MGGIATYTRDTARWLVKHGHSVHVVCVTRTSPPGEEDDEGVRVHFVRPTRIRPRQLLRMVGQVPGLAFLQEAYAGWDLLENSLGAWRAVWRLDRRMHFDVIECADFGGLAFWGLLSSLKSRTILRGHGYLHLELPHTIWPGRHFHHALEKFCVRQTRFVLTASEYLARCYVGEFGVEEKKVMPWPYGINQKRLFEQAACSTLRSMWSDEPTALYVGRIERQKGNDLLFSTLHIVHQMNPDFRAILVGRVPQNDRPAYDGFMEAARDWCWHPGEIAFSDVIALMLQSTLVVLPSRTDTLPRTLIEALFCGLPQVATHIGGIPEIIEDGKTGLLVPPEDTQALASAIEQICLSPSLLTRLRHNSKERALVKFDLEKVMTRQVQIYQSLIEGVLPLTSVQDSET
ncbi:MAG: glycosyltransferase family 4 protein [Anaerolineae bacterium]|nr:glycosyltransferase family 4 protein [Anaerolineae bacterium]